MVTGQLIKPNPQLENPHSEARQRDEGGGETGDSGGSSSLQMCIPAAGIVMEPLNGAAKRMQTES